MDASGELQYIPFPTCNETGRPLELLFGSEKGIDIPTGISSEPDLRLLDINCTLAELDDSLFHLLEFYIHNDAPLSCRVPSLPLSSSTSRTSQDYTHLQFALTGKLQLSHLHIDPRLNVIVHTTAPTKKDKTGEISTGDREGQILAATAYSLPPTLSSPQLVIGDPLPFQLTVRWYSARTLPPSTSRLRSGLGGHVHLSTVTYCILALGCGFALAYAYFRGIELPRRLKRYGIEKLGVSESGRGGYAFPGKRD